MKAITGVLVVAACATLGDAIWYTYGVRHTLMAGFVHGALLLAAVGAVLGANAGRVLKGLPIGAIAGIGGAATYYFLVAVVDRRTYGSAIPAAWIAMWLMLAALDGRWLRSHAQRTWKAITFRGLTAAVLSGVAFYMVMRVLWGRPPEAGRNYVVQFFAWVFAWAPGLFALTLGAERSIDVKELLERIDRGETLHVLDVRSESEFKAGHVPGAVNIPVARLLSDPRAITGTGGDELILYCGLGPRAHVAGTALQYRGRKRIIYMSGHWAAWQAAGLRTER